MRRRHGYFRTIYFVQCGTERGPIKIGLSVSPAVRLFELQAGCPYPLRLLVEINGSFADEAALHRRFAADRIHGEWFRCSDDLWSAIEFLKQARRPAEANQ